MVGKAASRGRKLSKAAAQSALNSDEQSLFAALKSLRMELAKEIEKPAYVVFSDASLLDMVAKVPSNKEEMLDVSRVGPQKLERYGEAFLDVIRGS